MGQGLCAAKVLGPFEAFATMLYKITYPKDISGTDYTVRAFHGDLPFQETTEDSHVLISSAWMEIAYGWYQYAQMQHTYLNFNFQNGSFLIVCGESKTFQVRLFVVRALVCHESFPRDKISESNSSWEALYHTVSLKV